MSRLDRLASVKDVAQMGAVMGREFSFETFLAAFHLPRDLAAGSLRVLVDGDVMVERGRPPNAVYSFKHALMQDAAYGSLLRDRRRALHLQVAETLERDVAGATAEPELLAYHFAEAGVADRAIDYHLKAAEQAMARCAIAEMVSHLRRGLGLLAALPDGPATRRRELALQTALGRGLIDNVGSASDEGHAAFVRARELCLELNETDLLLPILYGLQVYHFTHAEPEVVTRYAREILDLGARTGNRQATILGERVGGSAYLLLGRFAEARGAYENLLRLYDPADGGGAGVRRRRATRWWRAASFLGICLTVMGYPEQGRAVTARGLAHGETLGACDQRRVHPAPRLRHGDAAARRGRGAPDGGAVAGSVDGLRDVPGRAGRAVLPELGVAARHRGCGAGDAASPFARPVGQHQDLGAAVVFHGGRGGTEGRARRP